VKSLHKLWTRTHGLIHLARHVPGFLAEPLSVEQAGADVARGVEQRDARFLSKLDHVIYANPRNPYRKLLEACGCEYGDVRRLVETEGLDIALARLAEAGVFLTFEEFKNRVPTVRGSQSFQFEPDDFNDPTFRAITTYHTGGTSGRPMPFGSNFALMAQWAAHWCVFFAANNLLGKPLIFWTPGNSGSIGPQLACAKFKQRVDQWLVSQKMTDFWDRAYAWSRHRICRHYAGSPRIQHYAYHETTPVLESVMGFLNAEKAISVNTTPSAAVRLSLAAHEQD
jgi:hypothetical protein